MNTKPPARGMQDKQRNNQATLTLQPIFPQLQGSNHAVSPMFLFSFVSLPYSWQLTRIYSALGPLTVCGERTEHKAAYEPPEGLAVHCPRPQGGSISGGRSLNSPRGNSTDPGGVKRASFSTTSQYTRFNISPSSWYFPSPEPVHVNPAVRSD